MLNQDITNHCKAKNKPTAVGATNQISPMVCGATLAQDPSLLLEGLGAVRFCSLLCYFACFIAKFNDGFFDIAHSCNTSFISYNLAAFLPDAFWRLVSPAGLRGFFKLMAWIEMLVY